MFDVLDMGASGLQAQRTRMDTIAGNIVNANTTRNAQGQPVPYRRRFVVFAPGQQNNPDADSEGYVKYPNIDLAMEYVNALEASRAYEANVTMMEVSKAMLNASLR